MLQRAFKNRDLRNGSGLAEQLRPKPITSRCTGSWNGQKGTQKEKIPNKAKSFQQPGKSTKRGEEEMTSGFILWSPRLSVKCAVPSFLQILSGIHTYSELMFVVGVVFWYVDLLFCLSRFQEKTVCEITCTGMMFFVEGRNICQRLVTVATLNPHITGSLKGKNKAEGYTRVTHN